MSWDRWKIRMTLLLCTVAPWNQFRFSNWNILSKQKSQFLIHSWKLKNVSILKRNVNTIIILFLVICISNLGFPIYLLINLDGNHFLDICLDSGKLDVQLCNATKCIFFNIRIHNIVSTYVFAALIILEYETQHWDVLRQIWWSNIILTYTYVLTLTACRSVIQWYTYRHITTHKKIEYWIPIWVRGMSYFFWYLPAPLTLLLYNVLYSTIHSFLLIYKTAILRNILLVIC